MQRNTAVRLLGLFLSAMCILLVLAGTALATGGPRTVTVDASDQTGILRALSGVHRDPGAIGTALNDLYKSVGVTAVRTHDAGRTYTIVLPDGTSMTEQDAGVGDTDGYQAPGSIFPDFTKDPNDPKSYNFGPTDNEMANILSTGAEVFFAVGRSDRGGIDFANMTWFNNYVPPDLDKYGQIVHHIVMHYNKGWANGFHYGIKYWEIWNEPDFQPFWKGTAEQYYQLYKICAHAIKSADKNALIGGPANSTHNDLTGLEGSFLKFVKKMHLPLDFYSYHLYTNKSVNPLDNARFAEYFRSMLDSYGFTDTTIVNGEYGTALDGTKTIGGSVASAIFVAEAQMYMQDSPVAQAFTYSTIGFNRNTTVVSPTTHAWAMVESLSQKTPLRLATTGGDQNGFAVMAGKNTDTRELRAVIANYEISSQYMGPIGLPSVPGWPPNTEKLYTGPIPPAGVPAPGLFIATMTVLDRWLPSGFTYTDTEGYNLTINDIPDNWFPVTVKQYRVDNSNSNTLKSTTTFNLGDSVTLSGSWVHGAPTPGYDSVGVAPGMDLVVVTGSN